MKIDKLLVFDLKGKLACWKKFYSNSSSLTYEIPSRTNLIGILASILELNRDSYYELLNSNNCKISLQLKSNLRKQFHCLNYFKKPNKRDYTQVRLEVLQPLNIRDDLIIYRLYVWIKDSELFDKLITRIKEDNQGFGIYLGQRQFRGHIEFVDVTNNIKEIDNCRSTNSVLNVDDAENEEELVSENENICVERMPLDFEFVEKNKAGEIDVLKLKSNYLNRELLKIGRIAYPKLPYDKISSKSPLKNVFSVLVEGEEQNISFY